MKTDTLKSFFKHLTDMKKKDKVIISVCVIALFVLVCYSGISKSSVKQTENEKDSSMEYKTMLETQLKETLQNVKGVGEVSVMITLEAQVSQTPVFNENISESVSNDSSEKTSTQTSSSKDAVMVKDSSGTTPYTVSDKYPEIVGVIIVAQGAENVSVKSYIINAVKTSLGVSAHKIVVLPKE